MDNEIAFELLEFGGDPTSAQEAEGENYSRFVDALMSELSRSAGIPVDVMRRYLFFEGQDNSDLCLEWHLKKECCE